jgi:hypothetical protein
MLCLSSYACSASDDSASDHESEPKMSADLEPFLNNYFATWSAGNLEGYKAHFHENACIATVADGHIMLAMGRDEFAQYQEHAIQGRNLTERMTSFTADEDDVAATVTAVWALDDGARTTTGIDRFTLIRDRMGHWKIVSLLFYTNR